MLMLQPGRAAGKAVHADLTGARCQGVLLVKTRGQSRWIAGFTGRVGHRLHVTGVKPSSLIKEASDMPLPRYCCHCVSAVMQDIPNCKIYLTNWPRNQHIERDSLYVSESRIRQGV